MNINELDIGDVVYSAKAITDDGSMPDCSEGELLAPAGSRGVIVMKGHIGEEPQRQVFLVRFEDETLTLGRPIGCWSEDLSIDRQDTTKTNR
ncbi:nitrogen fixation protein NifZ [Methylotuvimicrobium sp. KM1]|uniref:nitrogen fixation protein NifZ n=1 Tax=Methylotuvimicrobium sp. KM1 TaxID=3377707 RepID=UPI00384DBBC4